MNSAQLFVHFDRISDAPDAVPRLRRFVLDLAVRGKLVDQNPDDEAAEALQKKIYDLRCREVGADANHNDAVAINDMPFALPVNWTWIRLGPLCIKTGSGSTPRGGKSVYKNRGVPFLRSQNVYNDGLRLDDVVYIDDVTHRKMQGTALRSGDLLLNITGGSIGRCCRVPGNITPANISQHVAIIRLVIAEMQEYMHRLVLSPYFQSYVLGEQTGAGRGGLPKNKMDRIPVALPPLAEQRRIVAKVDELMALCDRLEAAQRERELRRDRLNRASLHRLNNGADADAFRNHARFHLRHLPRLTTRPEHIRDLRQTILNLAVRGKLAPQDPDDESACELLKRVRVERCRVLNGRKPKFGGSITLEDCEKTPFDVPSGWIWAKANDIFLNITDGFHNTPAPLSEGHPYVTAKHIRPGKIDFASCMYVDEKNHKELIAKTRVKRGDILIVNIGAGCGTPAIVEVDFEFSFKNVAVVNVPSCLDNNYLFQFLMYYRPLVFEELIKGGAQPFLGLAMLREMLIPLPPLAEQHRIVAKVDELMKICDQLEAKLATTQTDSRHLLEALLHQALAPATAEKLGKTVAAKTAIKT